LDSVNERTAPYVGARVLRVEDERLLTGRGRYVADTAFAALAHLVLIRCEHPFADVLRIDTTAARAMPGVLGVWTAADLQADGLGGIPWELRPPVPPGTPAEALPPQGDPSVAPPQPLLADGVVRYQGEPVAMLAAATLAQAHDAVEHVRIDYAPRPAVLRSRDAVSPSAVQVWDRFPGNVCFRLSVGDPDRTNEAFARAAHVTALALDIPRLVQNPIETRAYVGEYDARTDRYTLHAAAGKPQTVGRAIASDILHIAKDRVRVIARDVGGGFGAKNTLYAEEALVLWTARKVGRPVRWIATRGEGFLSDTQARDQSADAALALDADGRIVAMRVRMLSNLGAYLGQRGVTPPTLMARIMTSAYAVPVIDYRGEAVHTNTVPTCPYRGAGAPEAMLVMEGLIDQAARELNIAPAALRRRNLIPASAMPFRTVLGATYDSGDFAANMDEAERAAEVAGFAARRAQSRTRGRLRGLGYANMMEACGHGIAEKAEVSCTPDGMVTVRIGSMSNGQSHETVYAQMLADVLGIDLARIRVIQGDSNETPEGWGTGASRSMTVGGSALVIAGERLIEVGKPIAADLLEAASDDVTYTRGGYTVVGTDRRVRLEDVAARVIAEGGRSDRGLEAEHRFAPVDATYPNGCHIAEVEIDPETGVVDLLSYTMAQDVGRALNPMVVEGQLAGGVAQGIGQALMERAVFDAESGQLLNGSFMDYAMPRADTVPSFATRILEVPCRHTPTGVKSCGEAGATAAPAAVLNAILDALWPLGVRQVPIPATPEAIYRAMRSAQGSSEAGARNAPRAGRPA
jgi:carbon-monoxide dehydrogenase large subunit